MCPTLKHATRRTHVVHGLLFLREFAVDGVRARDVGRVALVLRAHVQQDQVTVRKGLRTKDETFRRSRTGPPDQKIKT